MRGFRFDRGFPKIYSNVPSNKRLILYKICVPIHLKYKFVEVSLLLLHFFVLFLIFGGHGPHIPLYLSLVTARYLKVLCLNCKSLAKKRKTDVLWRGWVLASNCIVRRPQINQFGGAITVVPISVLVYSHPSPVTCGTNVIFNVNRVVS